MDAKVSLFLILLISSLTGWLVWDQFVPLEIDYSRSPYLIDPQSGEKIKPIDSIELDKVLKQSDNYVNNTNSIERLYDLVLELHKTDSVHIDQNYSSNESLRLSGLPHANRTKCAEDLNWILGELKKHEKFYPFIRGKIGKELTQLIDSIGKPEVGLFDGLVTWMGSYEQCKRLEFSENKLKMRYCWSRFRPKWWKHENERTLQKSVIRVGTCLPVSCDTQSDEFYSQEISSLVKFDWPEFYSQNLEFDSMFCLPDEESPLRQIPLAGYVFVLALLIWISLVLIASVKYEINKRNNNIMEQKQFYNMLAPTTTSLSDGKLHKTSTVEVPRQDCLKSVHCHCWSDEFGAALSLSKSLKSFAKNNRYVNYKHIDHHGHRLDTNWLDTLKSVMFFYIVVGHVLFVGLIYTRMFANQLQLFMSARNLMFALHFPDTFFVLSGIFGTFHLMSKFKLNDLCKPTIWFTYNMKTFLRIAPICITVQAFARFIGPYLGEGPWWDYGVDDNTFLGLCSMQNWWTIIPYFSQWHAFNVDFCNPPAWFLIVSLRLAFLIPIFVYIIHKLPNHLCRSLFVLCVSLITNALFALRLIRQDSYKPEAFSLYGGYLIKITSKFQELGGTFVYNRIGLIAMSCYFGYLLIMYKRGEIVQWPIWLCSRCALITVIFLNTIILFAPQIGFTLTEYYLIIPTINQIAISNYIMAILWPILNCLLILQTTTIYNHTALMRFFSHPIWTPLNKLSLCIFLTHWSVAMYSITSSESGPTYGFKSDLWRHTLFTYSITLIISTFAYLFIEAPMANMLTMIFKKLEKSHGTKEESSINN